MLNANQSTYFVIRHPLLLCTDEASHTQTFHPILQQIYVMISVRTAEGEFTGGSFSPASARQVGVGSPILEGCAEHAETVRFWLSISTTPKTPSILRLYAKSAPLLPSMPRDFGARLTLSPRRGNSLGIATSV
jgi:hypothetical protein